MRLIAFGGAAVGLGGLACLLGLASLVLPLFAAQRSSAGAAASAVGWRLAVSGALTYGLIGAALVSAGVGSIRRRRWVRSAMLALSTTWLAAGLIVVPAAWLLVGPLLDAAGGELPPELRSAVLWAVLGVISTFGLAVPAAFVWAYSDRDVQRTCDAHDARPSWAEGLPPAVSSLALGLGGVALLSAPLALQPAVPVFGFVATGWLGASLTLACGLACAWLARGIARRRPAAWCWLAVLIVASGASLALTLGVAGLVPLLQGLGQPAPALPESADSFAIAATVLLTLASLVWLLAVRRHFRS